MFWLLKYKVILDESLSFVPIFVFPLFSSRKEKLRVPRFSFIDTLLRSFTRYFFFIKIMREDQMRKN